MGLTNNVLVVDDETMIRDAVSACFTRMGWRAYEAGNGRDALALFEKTPISFVILDLMLPGMSGEDVCREMRKRSRVPIIMLTAKTQEESILNGLHIGADDYVTLSWEDDLVIDFEEASVRKKGALLSLTKSEWRILSTMASYPKKVFPVMS